MRTVAQLFLNFLLNAVWQVALIALAALVGNFLLRSATRFRHVLWATALMMSLALPLFSTIVSRQSESAPSVGRQNSIDRAILIPANIVSSDLPLNATRLSSGFHVSQRAAIALLIAFLAVVGYRAARLFRAWLKTKAIRRSTFSFEPGPELNAIAQRCQSVFGISRTNILSSRMLKTPATVGALRPLVILPEELLLDADTDALTAAVGHELAHIARCDYLLNLIYELIFLPLSFHPAAALIRRQITKTRELRCDELVAERLLQPEVYARSLVRLAGWAMPFNRRSQTIIVGIADADILEVRIMSLLGRAKVSRYRNKIFTVAALLLLALPCAAAASFRFNVNVDRPSESAVLQDNGPNLRERKARLIYHTEAEYTADARAQNITGKVILSITVGVDGLVHDAQVIKPLFPSLDQSAMAAARAWRFDPYIKDGQPTPKQLTVEVIFDPQQDRRARQEQEMKERAEKEDLELKQRIETETNPEARAKLEQLLVRRQQERGNAVFALTPNGEYKVIFDEEGQRREREVQAKQKAELAKAAKISMDQAIQIATSTTPGKVLECSLVGERWQELGKSATPSRVLYHVVIMNGDEANPVTTHVLVNAVDGSVVRTEKEERKVENPEYLREGHAPIEGGRLNGNAMSLPNPEYPAIARAARAEGSVTVQITIDETGHVVSARAVSGHPLLQAAAVSAARQALFAPTRLKGEPVKVTGSLVYDFVVQ